VSLYIPPCSSFIFFLLSFREGFFSFFSFIILSYYYNDYITIPNANNEQTHVIMNPCLRSFSSGLRVTNAGVAPDPDRTGVTVVQAEHASSVAWQEDVVNWRYGDGVVTGAWQAMYTQR
jgi:hypothetical protein